MLHTLSVSNLDLLLALAERAFVIPPKARPPIGGEHELSRFSAPENWPPQSLRLGNS